jgi:hypothetical protein
MDENIIDFANHYITDNYVDVDSKNEEAKAVRLKAYLAEEAEQKEKLKTLISEDHTDIIGKATGILLIDEQSTLKRGSADAGLFGDVEKYL